MTTECSQAKQTLQLLQRPRKQMRSKSLPVSFQRKDKASTCERYKTGDFSCIETILVPEKVVQESLLYRYPLSEECPALQDDRIDQHFEDTFQTASCRKKLRSPSLLIIARRK